mmetsp:Transcript_160211/g.283816  ORF Transcript_160211/g.283816 Transcript_160211/m.283816 type:complete len:592 (-) Transcript_160211:82-1857(-)
MVEPLLAMRRLQPATSRLARLVRPARGLFWRQCAGASAHHRAEVHGGDDVHQVGRFVCDFSVTSNGLGPVPRGVDATRKLFENMEISWTSPRGGDVKAIMEEESMRVTSCPAIEHYPKRTDAELSRMVAEFLRPASSQEVITRTQECLIFGNGASELVDLLARAAPDGPYCLNPFTEVQYREYERACKIAGRAKVEDPCDAAVICLVNPNNPTGHFMERAEMEAWISESASPGSWVLVDESMIFFAGPTWYERGVSAEFVERMNERNVRVFLVNSWTKIFSCTGIRIGSVVCPTLHAKRQLQAIQFPWSVSVVAQTYLKAALQDTEYLQKTWRATSHWREHAATRLQRLHPEWEIKGQAWLSWLWIDTGDAKVAQEVYQAALESGCPVRHAKFGYELPTHIRVAVRRPYDFAILYQALVERHFYSDMNAKTPFGTYADVHPSVVEGVHLVHIDDLKPHEEILHDRAARLRHYVEELPVKVLPAIIVDTKYKIVIDGHHRLELFKQIGMAIVPAVFVQYEHEDILVNPPGAKLKEVTKDDVIFNALKGTTMPPKSTQHMVRSRGGALMPIIVLAPQITELQYRSIANGSSKH